MENADIRICGRTEEIVRSAAQQMGIRLETVKQRASQLWHGYGRIEVGMVSTVESNGKTNVGEKEVG